MIRNRLHQYITFLFIILWSVLGMSAAVYEVKDVPNVHVADRTRFLSNPDGLISVQAQTIADSIMSDVWNKTTAEVTAVAVESIGNQDANQFATKLFEEWKIGKKDRDNGVLVLIVNDTHDIVIRTGYGAEGPLPDITAGRIIRDYMIPAFRQNGLDAGLLSGLSMVHDVLTDPAVAEELKSSIPNDKAVKKDESFSRMISDLIQFGCYLAIVMLVVVLVVSLVAKKQPWQTRYKTLSSLSMWTAITTVLGLGIPFLAFLWAKKLLKNVKNEAPRCTLCDSKMSQLPPNEATAFLTPQQATESRIRTMNHTVWRCPKDGNITVRSFHGPAYNNFTRCDSCGAHALHLNRSYITRKPSQFHTGERMDEYVCEHCGKITRRPHTIAKLIPPVILGGFGGGRGFGGGGGFSGGSFGGGSTGGGGASGRW
ncbi:MAG: TPM domain-containing protein [Muribaculaceae bacterium]|nr:TPM domain-containing protein [Muribaculaceae bacterium]